MTDKYFKLSVSFFFHHIRNINEKGRNFIVRKLRSKLHFSLGKVRKTRYNLSYTLFLYFWAFFLKQIRSSSEWIGKKDGKGKIFENNFQVCVTQRLKSKVKQKKYREMAGQRPDIQLHLPQVIKGVRVDFSKSQKCQFLDLNTLNFDIFLKFEISTLTP